MKHSTIEEKVMRIVQEYISDQKLLHNTPLTSKPYYISARSLAAIFIDIERNFGVDLNKVIDQITCYSIAGIANAVTSQV